MTKRRPISPDVWNSIADDVLSVLLTEEWVETGNRYFDRAVDEYGLSVSHFAEGPQRDLAQAVFVLRAEGRPVTWNAVADLSPALEQAYYAETVTLCDVTRMGGAFDDNVKLLIEYGTTLDAVGIMQDGQASLLAGQNRDDVIDYVVDVLTRTGVERIQNETADKSADEFEAMMSGAPTPLITTGIDWLDQSVGGFGENELWYLAGPYKSSKTRIAYNMALQAAKNGVSSAVLSLENLKREIVAQFVSMLAIEWLLASGLVRYTPEASAYWIGPKMLIRARNSYRNWIAVKRDAVDYGIAEYRRLDKRLRIYDRSASGGKLSDMKSIRGCLKRDKRLYDGRLYFVDHQGLVAGYGSVYEQTSETSKAFQELSRAFEYAPITLVVLAQLNEESIKAESEGYSAGVKGGGDSPANSDVLLTTKPVPVEGAEGEFYNDRTRLKVKHSRWGGGNAAELVGFHPESGLMMPIKTFNLNSEGVA